MAINIITPTQVIPVNAIKVTITVILVCKTTLGMTADKPLIIDFDKGAHRTGGNRAVMLLWLKLG
jgi:hypothetical protein